MFEVMKAKIGDHVYFKSHRFFGVVTGFAVSVSGEKLYRIRADEGQPEGGQEWLASEYYVVKV